MNPHHPQRITPENAGSIPFPCWLWVSTGWWRASTRNEFILRAQYLSNTTHFSTSPTKPEGVPAEMALEPETPLDTSQRLTCVCGQPDTQGVVHRKDGPCYRAQPPAGAREAISEVVYSMYASCENREAHMALMNARLFAALAPFLTPQGGYGNCPKCGRGSALCACLDNPASRAASPHVAAVRTPSAAARRAAKEFCTYTKQEESTEERLATIIDAVIQEQQGAVVAAYIAQSIPAPAVPASVAAEDAAAECFRIIGDTKWEFESNDASIQRFADIIETALAHPGATEDGRRLERAHRWIVGHCDRSDHWTGDHACATCWPTHSNEPIIPGFVCAVCEARAAMKEGTLP